MTTPPFRKFLRGQCLDKNGHLMSSFVNKNLVVRALFIVHGNVSCVRGEFRRGKDFSVGGAKIGEKQS